MAAEEIKKGLAGVVVDYTAISKVNPDTNSLLYRGYPVQELAARSRGDVPAVMRGFGTSAAEPIFRATPAAMRATRFAAGSMGPKVAAVCRFVEVTGDVGAIGALEDAAAILAGKAGTIVTPGGNYGGSDDLKALA